MQSEQVSISVIVPVYNTAPYLETCVDSILRQTFRDFEVILVDDGSTDTSPEICDHLAKRDARIRVLHKENGGLSDARNHGIGMARGRFLAFVDSDDALHPQMLQALETAARQTGAPVAMCLFREVTALPQEQTRYDLMAMPVQVEAAEDIFTSITVEYVVAWNKLYRADLFARLRYPLGRLHEDEFVAHRWLWQAGKVARVDLPLYWYLQRPQSIMHTAITPKRLDGLDAMRDRVEFCLEMNRPDLACRSVDSLLGVTEALLRRRDEMTPEARELFEQGTRQDALRWPEIQNRSQKQRWQQLCKRDPDDYFAWKARQEKQGKILAKLKKPLKRFLNRGAGQEERK